METEVYYKKVEIKTEADLPKEGGNYFSQHGHALPEAMWAYRKFDPEDPQSLAIWLHSIDWYLLPVPSPSAVIAKQVVYCPYCNGDDIFSIVMNHHKCRDCGAKFDSDVELASLSPAKEERTPDLDCGKYKTENDEFMQRL
jgi:DNA-directed RNA polymerase subunit RPC12/RpoP